MPPAARGSSMAWEHSTSDGHHGIQQQQVSIVLTRVCKSVISPMFLGLARLTLANGRKVGYTNEKTDNSVIQKPLKSSLHKPCVAGSSPAFATIPKPSFLLSLGTGFFAPVNSDPSALLPYNGAVTRLLTVRKTGLRPV